MKMKIVQERVRNAVNIIYSLAKTVSVDDPLIKREDGEKQTKKNPVTNAWENSQVKLAAKWKTQILPWHPMTYDTKSCEQFRDGKT